MRKSNTDAGAGHCRTTMANVNALPMLTRSTAGRGWLLPVMVQGDGVSS